MSAITTQQIPTAIPSQASHLAVKSNSASKEPFWVQCALIAISIAFLLFFLVLPLVAVFAEALRKGILPYLQSLIDPSALSAIKLTLLTAGIAVPVNLVFGLAASWAIAKYDFVGKSLLTTLIDIPFAVSPVISD